MTVVLRSTKHGRPPSGGKNAGSKEEDFAATLPRGAGRGASSSREVDRREAPSRRRRLAVYSSAGETSLARIGLKK